MIPANASTQRRHLLIVDDDVAQVSLFRCLLRELGYDHRCHHVASGGQALDFLRGKHPYEDAPRPDLIILDVNMPGMNGCEVLSKIKSDPAFSSIPVVMFSVGISQAEINHCYAHHANAYVQKPLDYHSNLCLINELQQFWFQIARLPGA
ncbi:MAG: response regulator [Bryobacteraceae bacterium]